MTPFMGEELARSRMAVLRRAAEDDRLARVARNRRRRARRAHLAERSRQSLRRAVGSRVVSLGLRLLGDG